MSLTIFARNLRHLRKLKGLSQKQAGKKIFVSRQLFGFMEQGKHDPNLRVVQRVCIAFEVDILTITEIDLTAA